MAKAPGRNGYLLHNYDGRFEGPNGNLLPVAEGSFVDAEQEFRVPENTVFNVREIVDIDDEMITEMNNARMFLNRWRGINHDECGSHLAEYNFRYYYAQPRLDVGNFLVEVIAALQAPLLNDG